MINKITPRQKPVIVISLLTAACLLGDSMLYIVLPIHWAEVGLSSLWEVGVLLSVNRLVRLPCNPLVGWLYGRISHRRGVVLAGLLAIATTVSYAFIQGFAFWLVARCVWGLAWTFLRLGAYFLILESADDHNRGHYMGLYNGLYRLGSLVGMLAGGVLAERVGIGATSLLFAGLTFCALPFALQLPASITSPTAESEPSRDRTFLAQPNVVWTLLTGLFIAMVYQGAFMATLSRLIQVHQPSPVVLGRFVIAAAPLAGILQALRWSWEPWLAPWFGRLSDQKYGRRKMLAATLGLAALSFSLISLPLPLAPWLLLLLVILLTATILTTVIDAIACDVAVDLPPKAFMSAYSFAIDIGAALGPVASYTLSDLYGPYAVYWAIAVGSLLLSLKWLRLMPIK